MDSWNLCNVNYWLSKMPIAKLFFFTRLVPNCPDSNLSILLVWCEISEGLRGAKLSLCQTATLHLWNKVEKGRFYIFFRSSWIECSFQSAARRLRCWLARPMRIIKSETCFRKTWCWERLVIAIFYFFGHRWYIFRFHSTFTRRVCSAEPESWAVEWFKSILRHFPF